MVEITTSKVVQSGFESQETHTVYNSHMKEIPKYGSKRNGHLFLLTEGETLKLLEEAGITLEEWTFKGYHLARNNDQGNYELGNCRFISAVDNYAEHNRSAQMREISSAHLKRVNQNLTTERRKEWGKLGGLKTAMNGKPVNRSYKCQPDCTCGRHKNGGWNKGIPWSQWFNQRVV